jgi:muramoyltetrapeptide carboxypeptidase
VKQTIIPPPLKKGDTLALFSPSSPGDVKFPQQYNNGIKALHELGYQTSEMEIEENHIGYRSASPVERANHLHTLFLNQEIKGILCNIGGYNTNEMLPFIDFDIIRNHPKFICGYSDSSVLLNAITHKTDIVTFHGPMVIPSFGEYPKPLEYTVEHFQAMAHQTINLPHKWTPPTEWTDEFVEWIGPSWGTRSRKMTENKGPIWVQKHKENTTVSGFLVGGNTDSLLPLINTEYFKIPENSILFIEDISVSIEKWAMLMWSLKIKGVFKRINALLIGKMEGIPNGNLLKMIEIIKEILHYDHVEIPVVAELDIGHTAPMFTLPIGSTISIDSGKEEITLVKLNGGN